MCLRTPPTRIRSVRNRTCEAIDRIQGDRRQFVGTRKICTDCICGNRCSGKPGQADAGYFISFHAEACPSITQADCKQQAGPWRSYSALRVMGSRAGGTFAPFVVVLFADGRGGPWWHGRCNVTRGQRRGTATLSAHRLQDGRARQ